MFLRGQLVQVIEVHVALAPLLTYEDAVPQVREAIGSHGRGVYRAHLRSDGLQQLDVVSLLEPGSHNKRRDLDLLECMLELYALVPRVDVHEDQVREGGGELTYDPLRTIRSVDADPSLAG